MEPSTAVAAWRARFAPAVVRERLQAPGSPEEARRALVTLWDEVDEVARAVAEAFRLHVVVGVPAITPAQFRDLVWGPDSFRTEADAARLLRGETPAAFDEAAEARYADLVRQSLTRRVREAAAVHVRWVTPGVLQALLADRGVSPPFGDDLGDAVALLAERSAGGTGIAAAADAYASAMIATACATDTASPQRLWAWRQASRVVGALTTLRPADRTRALARLSALPRVLPGDDPAAWRERLARVRTTGAPPVPPEAPAGPARGERDEADEIVGLLLRDGATDADLLRQVAPWVAGASRPGLVGMTARHPAAGPPVWRTLLSCGGDPRTASEVGTAAAAWQVPAVRAELLGLEARWRGAALHAEVLEALLCGVGPEDGPALFARLWAVDREAAALALEFLQPATLDALPDAHLCRILDDDEARAAALGSASPADAADDAVRDAMAIDDLMDPGSVGARARARLRAVEARRGGPPRP